MKLLTAFAIILGISTEAHAGKIKHNEAFFCDIVAEKLNGTSEVKTKFNKRIDILTKDTAWECDWTHKPYEAIGQALAYSHFENLKPGIIFFQDSNKKIHKRNKQMMKELAETHNITLKYYEINKKTGFIKPIER